LGTKSPGRKDQLGCYGAGIKPYHDATSEWGRRAKAGRGSKKKTKTISERGGRSGQVISPGEGGVDRGFPAKEKETNSIHTATRPELQKGKGQEPKNKMSGKNGEPCCSKE